MRRTTVRFWLITLTLALVVILPSAAQENTCGTDIITEMDTLLAQAQEAFASGDTITGNAFIADARALAAPCMDADVPDITQPVTSNADWTPIIQEFDGVEMVLVPTGCFLMGNDPTAFYLDSIGQFAQGVPDGGTQCFDEPFWIDRYEVTNGQFAQFGGQAVQSSDWTGDNLPRETINWFEARDFCELRGARLPTEAEWEYSARGPDGLIYPWGNELAGSMVNFCDTNCEYGWKDTDYDDGYPATAPVGSYEGGVSWVGAYDLSGNVMEWVSTIYQDYPYNAGDGRESNSDTHSYRVLRGGSWGDIVSLVRAANRARFDPDSGYSVNGFRCARANSDS